MTKADKIDLGKLAKILGRLGSDSENEVQVAIKQALSMLKAGKCNWQDVLREAKPKRRKKATDTALGKGIIEAENILDVFAEAWSNVMAGEKKNAKLLYLAATSRLLDKCINVAVKGPSSAGKSEIRKRVLSFIPPEDVISFSTVSEKALIYYEDDFPHKILSMGEAAGSEEKDMQDYLLRELMSEGKLRYIVAQRNGTTLT